ncbi:Karyogamy protein KAR4 [Nakaseomyces bracarensis]|uniref:Karyogamy protein KAR4 n=1 Tax=Nakaseomyces bracarensis TaxID=273131 RepID=A0ABR4NYQ2_9SACH
MIEDDLYSNDKVGNNSLKEHILNQLEFKSVKEFQSNDYNNNYIQTGETPQKYVSNVELSVEGYPKLQKLFKLKEERIKQYATKPLGCRVDIDRMVPTLNEWINNGSLVFDVVMLGCLTENQFLYPLLTKLPLDKLISKPGFLFVWGSARKIQELAKLLNNGQWEKKFRRSEELVFVPINKNSPYFPGIEQDDTALIERMQWHCWMCITGTVRRSTDGHLIHCNIDTDMTIENKNTRNNAVPDHLYRVVENFSTSNRRLHIIPSRTGSETPVRARPGWVIMSPDILLNNFSSEEYKQEIANVGTNVPNIEQIESLRPKSPVIRGDKSLCS